jgi:hypothetical protein
MEHALYLSTSEAALSARLLADLRVGREGRPLAPTLVLVRSNLVGLQLGRRLAREAGAYANVRFPTFVDLARRLAGPGADLPAGGESVILGALAGDLPADSFFGPVKDKAGFADTLAAAAEDARQAGLGSWDADLNLGERLTLFGKLFGRYRASLTGEGRAFRDEYDVFSAAASGASTFRELFGASELYVFGFYDFNELQRRLLEALGRAVRLSLYVPYGEGRQFRFARGTREWLDGLGCRADVLPADGASAGLPAARRWYGGDGPVSAEGVGIISAPDAETEAREIAREVIRLSRKRGVRLAEMAVLYRGEQTLALLREVFDRVLPGAGGRGKYYAAGGLPLSAARAGDGAKRLLELARHAQTAPRPFDRREVVDFVATAPVKPREGGEAGRFEAALWDDISAAAGVVYGRAAWAERLARYAAACERMPAEERRHEAGDVRALLSFTERLFADLERFPAEASWRDFSDKFARLLKEYFEEAEETEAVRDVIDGLASYDELATGPVALKVFAETFARRLSKASVPAGRFERDGINLIELDHARGLTFRAVFVPAVTEAAYPGRSPQDPVILDAERAAFNERARGRWRFNLRGERLAEEPLIFHLGLGAAREFLRVSYHRMDDGGRVRLPSHYLLKLAGALAATAFGAEDFDRAAAAHPWFKRAGISAAPVAADAIDEAEYWAGRAGELGDAPVGAYLAASEERWAAARDAAASSRAPPLTPFDGLISSEEGKAFLGKRYGRGVVPISASDLEALAACPRKYFFDRILDLRPWEEPEEPLTLLPTARGKVVHGVLRALYERRLPFTSSAAELSAEVARLTGAELAALEAEGVLPLPFVLEMERRLLSGKIAAFAREDAAAGEGWEPTYFELRFGRRRPEGDDAASTERPFIVEFAGEADAGGGPAGAAVHGRIDRVDLKRGGARVLDYKTGRRSRFVEGLDGGRQLQPALYLMAYDQLFDVDLAASWAGYCFPLEDGKKYKYVVSEKRPLDEAAVRAVVAGVLALARDGAFVAGRDGSSRADAACRYCEFRAVCDAGPGYLNAAKWESPPAARLLALREMD